MFSQGEALVEMEAKIFYRFCLWYVGLVGVYWWAGFLTYGEDDVRRFRLVYFQPPFTCPVFNLA
jgi:hypothetical protein